MKSLINNAKIALIAFMAVFTMASAQTVAIKKDNGPIEFTYLGTTNSQPVFLLNLNNTETEEFVITLKTSSGEIFFTEKISGKEIVRRYRLDTDELDASSIKVEVRSKKNSSKIVYAVNKTTRTVEDVVISKL